MAANPRVFGKYQVIRRLAVGGMGEIFLARQVGMAGFERLVILKSLLPRLASDGDVLAQFLDEARIVGNVNHPNVVGCYQVGDWQGVHFIAMEYINGVDLARLSRACADQALRFPINVAMSIAREAALGLDSVHHAHDRHGRALKIVHRDMSPQNLMVRHDGLAKIVDFGVAATRLSRAEHGLLKGKLGYLSPEQIKGEPLDGRSDQFSLGVLLWELLSGRRLFPTQDAAAVFLQTVHDSVPAPSSVMVDVPPELDAIVSRMTAQHPADRYPQLSEVAAALRRLLAVRGARESEAAELIERLVGGQLAERARDLPASPVSITGMLASSPARLGASPSPCPSCHLPVLRGDHVCHACGAQLGAASHAPAQTTLSPRRHDVSDERFATITDDMVDGDVDVSTIQTAVCIVALDIAQGGASSAAQAPTSERHDALLSQAFAPLEEFVARCDGVGERCDARFVATFIGTSRATRSALAFARRAATLHAPTSPVRRRTTVAGLLASTDTEADVHRARGQAERALACAHGNAVIVTNLARSLAGAAHAWTGRGQLSALADGEPLTTWEVPLAAVLAGRSDERAIIEQAMAAADRGSGQQHLLLGAAGQGKTALLHFIDSEARDRGFIVARARCGWRGVSRYDAVRQAMRSACRELLVVDGTIAPARRDHGDWQRGLQALALTPHERRRISAFVDAAASGDQELPLARRRVLQRSAIISFWASLAERRGACLLIDDVHNADPSSLEVFAEVGARLHSARFAMFATGQPVPGARVLPLARRALLAPLHEREIAQVASRALGAPLCDPVARKIADASAGNPLFATLLSRYLKQMHLVQVIDGEFCGTAELAAHPAPPTLSLLLFGAHALLSADARAVLVAAAHLGASFTLTDLTVLSAAQLTKDSCGGDPLPSLQECVLAGALIDEGGGRYAFGSASEAELLAARADPALTRRYHTALGRALALDHVHDQRHVEVEERLVEHALAAGDSAGAAAAALRAADAWVVLGAVDAAGDHYHRALQAEWRTLRRAARPGSLASGTTDNGVDEEQARRVLQMAARATAALSEIDAPAALDIVMPLLRALPRHLAQAERAAALRARGAVLVKLRRTDTAVAVFQEALVECAASEDSAGKGVILVDAALALEHSGEPDGARDRYHEALQILLRAPGPERVRAIEALLALGRLFLAAHELAHAHDVLQQALDEARRQGAVSWEIEVLIASSNLEQLRGAAPRAAAALDHALLVAARIGDGIAEARVRYHQARAFHADGKPQDAIRAARSSLAGATRLGWDEGMALAQKLLHKWDAR